MVSNPNVPGSGMACVGCNGVMVATRSRLPVLAYPVGVGAVAVKSALTNSAPVGPLVTSGLCALSRTRNEDLLGVGVSTPVADSYQRKFNHNGHIFFLLPLPTPRWLEKQASHLHGAWHYAMSLFRQTASVYSGGTSEDKEKAPCRKTGGFVGVCYQEPLPLVAYAAEGEANSRNGCHGHKGERAGFRNKRAGFRKCGNVHIVHSKKRR